MLRGVAARCKNVIRVYIEENIDTIRSEVYGVPGTA